MQLVQLDATPSKPPIATPLVPGRLGSYAESGLLRSILFRLISPVKTRLTQANLNDLSWKRTLVAVGMLATDAFAVLAQMLRLLPAIPMTSVWRPRPLTDLWVIVLTLVARVGLGVVTGALEGLVSRSSEYVVRIDKFTAVTSRSPAWARFMESFPGWERHFCL